MMDKTYILKNGLLEQYLLGELSNEEQNTVELLLKKHADLRQLFNDLEVNFESMAFENAIDPPKSVKNSLMANIKLKHSKVAPFNKIRPFKTYFSIAASITSILFIGSIWMFTQLNKTKLQLQSVEERETFLLKNIEGLNENLKISAKWIDLLNSLDTERFVLKGNSLAPNSKVVSYVNHKDKMVIVNAEDLPILDDEHDYQMWADVEGKMISMGIIEKNTPLVALTYINNAESLNITIEPAGGNDHPTVSKLVTNVFL